MLVLLAVLVAALASCGQPAAPLRPVASPTSIAPTVTARDVGPDPRVGAIFLGSDDMHSCSGSVLDSAAGDLILTAAHCMVGGIKASFVPGFVRTAEPQRFWQIDEVYLDPRWVSDQDPLADFAIARVSRQAGGSVEAAAGGGFTLGSTPGAGTDITVTGYAFGVGGDPIGCAAHTAPQDRGYPTLRCAGLVDGTSGSPWMTGSTVVGVTGGLEGGGCQENVSYTPPFDGTVKQLLARAESGGPGDVLPTQFDAVC